MPSESDPTTSSDTSSLSSVPQPLRAAMERRGFTDLTSVQRAILGADTRDRCLRISSQTGSGKTIALGLVLSPGFVDTPHPRGASPRAVIVTPTRELAMQVRDELRWLFAGVEGLFVGGVTGGTDISAERRMLQGGPAILIGTPGRLLDHVRRGALRCDNVQHVVLDEADRMLDMGFREELEAIMAAMPEERRTHLVSATFPPHVTRLANAVQTNALHVEGTALGAAHGGIAHVANLVAPKGVYPALVNALLVQHGQRVLVFVERRCDAASMASSLAADGFSAQAFSGELSQAQRTRTLNQFRRGSTKILVSTDVAARGIDVADIAMVIHASLPGDPDSYVHRAGRTGRAGATGTSLSLVPFKAKHYMERLARVTKVDMQWRAAPSPSKIRKTLRKKTRRAIATALETATAPTPERLEEATALLEGRDPAAVVAMLLEKAGPDLPCEPKSVPDGPPPGRDGPGPKKSYGARPKRHGAGPKRHRPQRRADATVQ